MARTRSSGGGGLAIALVIFGVGFVVCLILAILFYTQIEEAQIAAQNAEGELTQYVTGGDRNNPTVAEARNQSGSVVSNLLESITEMEAEITTLKDAADRFTQSQEAKDTEISRLEEQLTTVRRDMTQARAQLTTATQEFERRARDFEQRTRTAEDRANNTVTQADSAVTEVRTNYTSNEQSWADRIAEAERSVVAAQEEVQRLTGEVDRLQRLLREAQQKAIVQRTSVDATVARVVADGGQVYLNLGRNQQVPLGLTFEIYDADRVLKLDEEEEISRGKATVEVFQLADNTSLARVVRQESGTTLREGDKAVNVVYSPNTTFLFQVYGRFNIEGSSNVNVNDYDKVLSLIRQAGGRVAPELETTGEEARLSHEVDYLVLGLEPDFPAELDPDEIDPAKISRRNEQLRSYNTYQALRDSAQRMGIPILNQNRFLYLSGYYTR